VQEEGDVTVEVATVEVATVAVATADLISRARAGDGVAHTRAVRVADATLVRGLFP